MTKLTARRGNHVRYTFNTYPKWQSLIYIIASKEGGWGQWRALLAHYSNAVLLSVHNDVLFVFILLWLDPSFSDFPFSGILKRHYKWWIWQKEKLLSWLLKNTSFWRMRHSCFMCNWQCNCFVDKRVFCWIIRK